MNIGRKGRKVRQEMNKFTDEMDRLFKELAEEILGGVDFQSLDWSPEPEEDYLDDVA